MNTAIVTTVQWLFGSIPSLNKEVLQLKGNQKSAGSYEDVIK